MANGNGGEVDERMKKEMEKTNILTIANGITTLRILGSIALLVIDRTSAAFMIVYTLTGVTDALDGWIARKTARRGNSEPRWTALRICCSMRSCSSSFFLCYGRVCRR